MTQQTLQQYAMTVISVRPAKKDIRRKGTAEADNGEQCGQRNTGHEKNNERRMKKMKNKVTLVIVLTALLTLTACDGNTPDSEGKETPLNTSVFYKDLPNGQTVMCLLARDKMSGGSSISCDWDNKTVKIGEK
jgi:hypothetical protein